MTNRRGNHEGSIRKLPSGSFRVQVTINGKRIRFSAPNARKFRIGFSRSIWNVRKLPSFP